MQSEPAILDLDQNSPRDHITVSLEPWYETIKVRTGTGLTLGTLNAYYSKMLLVLRGNQEIELQSYVNIPRNPEHGRFKGHHRETTRKSPDYATLAVIIYGHTKLLDVVGDFLFQCSEYLQLPLHCDRNVPYRNPQSFSGRDENPRMTYQLQAEPSILQIETLAQAEDCSDSLESDCIFPEAEPPAAIRTTLYRYVLDDR